MLHDTKISRCNHALLLPSFSSILLTHIRNMDFTFRKEMQQYLVQIYVPEV